MTNTVTSVVRDGKAPARPAAEPPRPAPAPNPLSPSGIFALQRTAGNQAVARMLAATQPRLRAPAASIQRIEGGQEAFKGRWVKHKKNRKIGQIDDPPFKNKNAYFVKWVGSEKPEPVPANALDFTDEPKGKGDKTEEEKGSATTTELTSEEVLQAPEYRPAKLLVKAKRGAGKRWKLHLLDADDVRVGSVELQTNNAKTFVNSSFLVGGPKTVEGGTWPLTSPLLTGTLLETHVRQKRQLLSVKESRRQFAEFQAAMGDGDKVETHGHDEAYDRLASFKPGKDHGITGHPRVMMYKIELTKPHTLHVGGEDRAITHVYTQVGSPTEIRCYVGNAQGAYQRVHTSLTKDPTVDLEKKEKKAHTMVQTGGHIAVPGWVDAEDATRVGFDSDEGDEPGFAKRLLGDRGALKSTVNTEAGSIKGQGLNQLSEDAQLGSMALAQRFNVLLDQVIADLFKNAAGRSVVPVSLGFKVLDDEWSSEAHKGTPEHEHLEPLLGALTTNAPPPGYPVDGGIDKVHEQFTITHLAGDNWVALLRGIAAQLKLNAQTLVSVHHRLRNLKKPGLLAILKDPVQAGATATDLLEAITHVTGRNVSVAWVAPQPEGEPQITPRALGEGDVEVMLIRSGARFSLAQRKG